MDTKWQAGQVENFEEDMLKIVYKNKIKQKKLSKC